MYLTDWNSMARMITLREGKTSQLTIAQVKEVIGILADEAFQAPDVAIDLVELGRRRLRKRNRKTKAARRK